VKDKLKFHHSYFPMAKLLFRLYDSRSKHLGILEERNATTQTNHHLNHFNHEGAVKYPRNKKKIHMQKKYNAATFSENGDPSPFFVLEESRTTPFQEEDDMHMPILTNRIESRTTTFQEGEDDEDIPAIRNPDASLVTPDASLVIHQKSSAQPVTQDQALDTQVQLNKGSVTRRHVKKLQQEVHAFLSELHYNITNSHILPKSYTLILPRFTQETSPLGYTEDTKGYTKGTKTTAQDEKAYAHKTQGYMTEASTSHPSLCHLGKRQGPNDTSLEAP
jgi:hypothetical protein